MNFQRSKPEKHWPSLAPVLLALAVGLGASLLFFALLFTFGCSTPLAPTGSGEAAPPVWLEPMPTGPVPGPKSLYNRARLEYNRARLEWNYDYLGRDNGGFTFEVWHSTNLAEGFTLLTNVATNLLILQATQAQEFFKVRAVDMWGQTSDWASAEAKYRAADQPEQWWEDKALIDPRTHLWILGPTPLTPPIGRLQDSIK